MPSLGSGAITSWRLRLSGAVQAARWAKTCDGTGYIYSFNGPQSLFVDTIRSCRSLALAHQLGHYLMSERDEKVNLLQRLVDHASNTACYNIWYGEDRDAYDVAGRTAHESLFNAASGDYRCPSTQQGYSPFSTWTRGLAWAMLGFAELLEWLATRSDHELATVGGRAAIESVFVRAARATSNFYIRETPTAVCRIGILALQASPSWATISKGRPIRSTISSRSTARRPRSRRRDCCGWGITWFTIAAKRRTAFATCRPA